MSLPDSVIDFARRIRAEAAAPLYIALDDGEVKTIERGDTIILSSPDWEILAQVADLDWPGRPVVYWPSLDLTWRRSPHIKAGTLYAIRKPEDPPLFGIINSVTDRKDWWASDLALKWPAARHIGWDITA